MFKSRPRKFLFCYSQFSADLLARLNLLPEISNARYHFAVGDIARWSGIKRCGTAMHMGQYAAHNIHQLMLQNLHQEQPSFKELDPIPPMMAIAIGKQAVAYHPSEGTTFGEQVLKSSFGDDLGDSSRYFGSHLAENANLACSLLELFATWKRES